MVTQFRNNHYVPQWYQRRFIPPGQAQHELYYLDLKPAKFTDTRGVIHERKPLYRKGVKKCFSERDLYTTRFGTRMSVEIEQKFFGTIDRNGHRAVDYFTSFRHGSAARRALPDMLLYMSTQKLRTPKGLDWLSRKAGTTNRNRLMALVQFWQELFCATWTESIWQIVGVSQSPTKLVVSDHPVTVYNRKCRPRSPWCRGPEDPDIRFHASHTLFPLSLEKILILTNLSWIRNPYQSETKLRPNPAFFRSTVFNYTAIQTGREFSEEEVRQVNLIIKCRAYRHIAAGREEWLFPERYVSVTDWSTFGHGYLLMPDPRPIHMGGEVIIGWRDGSASRYDEYGRPPWDADYGKTPRQTEFQTLQRFKGEFARLFGPYRRGRTFSMGSLDPEEDDEEFHAYHLGLDRQTKKKRRKRKR